MSAGSLSCPSCGAALSLQSRFVKVVACDYCGQTSVVQRGGGLDARGKGQELIDTFSILSVGSTGSLGEGRPFAVLGRVQYRYEQGRWDEWFLRFEDDSFGWLEEDEGQFTLYRPVTITSAIPERESLRVGATVSVNGSPCFITERITAETRGAEGQLFFTVVPGEEVLCVDGVIDSAVCSIEWSVDEVSLSFGEPIDIDLIHVSG